MSWPLLSTPAIAELAAAPHWVCWQYCADRRTGRLTKRPFTPAGSPASSTDPRTWSSYAECWAAAFVDGRHDGIGRVLVQGEGLVGVDLDDAVAALDGAIAPWADEVVRALASYAERSPSGGGLHVWVRGAWPTPGNKRGNVEVYAAGRFLTVTGRHFGGTPETIESCGPGLAQLWLDRFQGRNHAREGPGAPVSAHHPMPEDELAYLARTRPQLRRVLERSYASQSEQDLALVRIARLFGWPPGRAWGLVLAVRSDSKAARPDYAARTLAQVY